MTDPLQTGNTEQQRSTGSSSGDAQVFGDSPSASSQSVPNLAERFANGFDFKDPVEMLFFVDEDIQSGRVVLHKWQIQCLMDFADERHTKDHPFVAEIAAANGSGKDMYIVAACAVWLAMRYTKVNEAITNGSGTQLDTQTSAHIESLCLKVNKKFGMMIWKTNYRYYECLFTQSCLNLFATDEPGKAEGYHPLEAGAKFAIFTSESKSIPDAIFAALTRCTGFTHRVDVSSPGNTAGYFHAQWNLAIDRNEVKDIKDVKPPDKLRWKITAYDCPHISKTQIEQFAQDLLAQGGLNSPVFKSGVDCEFGNADEMTVIKYTHLNRCKNNPKIEWRIEQFNHAGLDLNSGGSAESVLVVRNGNKVIAIEPFKFVDTTDNEDYCEELFYKHSLDNQQSLIWGDCCGAGYPQLCTLRKRGWNNIRFFDSRNASRKPKAFKNIITEMWANFSKLLENAEIIMPMDKLLDTQLVTRYYKVLNTLQWQLLSKLEQKSKGFPSPDRADALIYSFVGYKSIMVEPMVDNDKAPVKCQVQERPVGRFHQQLLTGRGDTPKSRLPVRPDMTYLQSQLDELNRQRKTN